MQLAASKDAKCPVSCYYSEQKHPMEHHSQEDSSQEAHQHEQVIHVCLDVVSVLQSYFLEFLELHGTLASRLHERRHPGEAVAQSVPRQTYGSHREARRHRKQFCGTLRQSDLTRRRTGETPFGKRSETSSTGQSRKSKVINALEEA